MKVVSSLKSLKKRDLNNKLVKRRGKLYVINKNLEIKFFNEVSFVAIKNGKHDQKGYVFCSPNLNFKTPQEPIHVSKIHNLIMSIL